MAKVSAVDTYRAVLQTDYCEYVKYVHHGAWKVTPFHSMLCGYVQNFVERETDRLASLDPTLCERGVPVTCL